MRQAKSAQQHNRFTPTPYLVCPLIKSWAGSELPWIALSLEDCPVALIATSVSVTCSLFNDLPSEVVRDNVGGGTWQVRAGRRTNLTGTERRMWTDAVKIWYRGPERPKIIKDHWENAIFVVEDFRWFSVAAHQALIFAGIFLASVFGLYWMAYGFGDDKQDGISSANLKASNSQMRSSALMFRCFPSSSSFCFLCFSSPINIASSLDAWNQLVIACLQHIFQKSPITFQVLPELNCFALTNLMGRN